MVSLEETHAPDEEIKVEYTQTKDLKCLSLTAEELELEMPALKKAMVSIEWINIFTAIDQLRAICKGSYPVLAERLASNFMQEISAGVLNLRSTIAKNCLLLVQDIYGAKRGL